MNFDYTLYLVTDRQLMSCDSLTEAVEQAILGGCTMIQLREKELPNAPMNRSLAMNCFMQFRNTENRSVKKAKQLKNAPTRQTFSKAKCSVLIVAEAFTGNVPSAGKVPILIGSTALQTAG